MVSPAQPKNILLILTGVAAVLVYLISWLWRMSLKSVADLLLLVLFLGVALVLVSGLDARFARRVRVFWAGLCFVLVLQAFSFASSLISDWTRNLQSGYLYHFAQLMSFAVFVAAILVKPQKPNHHRGFYWSKWVNGSGIAFLTAAALSYGFILPAYYPPGAGHYAGALIVAVCSGLISCWLLFDGLSEKSQQWRRVFLTLGAVAALWFLRALGQLLTFHVDWAFPTAILDAIALVILAAGVNHDEIIPVSDDSEEKSIGASRLGAIWGLAITAPLFHYVRTAFLENPDALLETQRVQVMLVTMLVLAGVGLAQSFYLRRRHFVLKSEPELNIIDKDRDSLKFTVQKGIYRLSQTENHLREQIARRIEAEQVLKQSEHRFRVLVETMNEGMRIVNEQREITYVNQALCRMFGYKPQEMLGVRVDRFVDHENHLILTEEQDKRKLGLETPYEISWRHKDGHLVPTLVSPRAIRNDEGELIGTFSVVTDITEQKRIQEEMRQMAHYDPLTGLPNRGLLKERLDRGIKRANRTGKKIAVLFMDMDRFKRINDSLGHGIGDHLLVGVARRLESCVRQVDTVARLGGDEMTVILSDIARSMDVVLVVDKIIAAFEEPFKIEGYEISMTPSIGIAMYPGDGEDGSTLLKNADAAMYHVKMQGRNNYQFYTEEMNQAAMQRLELENRLRHALENAELRLLFQPKLDLSTGKITGAEALARWRHPEMGLVVPDKFIPVAEETGLIHPLGAWVLEETCRQIRNWLDDGLPPISFAINLSPMQFNSETLPAQIVSALSKSGVSPELLELEITESLAMEDAERTIRVLAHLKAIGIKVTIDDFGTGYSSLSYLKRFPIDSLKIDRGFIRDLIGSTRDQAITKAIISMSHGLGLQVVAEGVERSDVLIALQSLSCDEAQGFHICPPGDIPTLKRLVLGRNPDESMPTASAG